MWVAKILVGVEYPNIWEAVIQLPNYCALLTVNSQTCLSFLLRVQGLS